MSLSLPASSSAAVPSHTNQSTTGSPTSQSSTQPIKRDPRVDSTKLSEIVASMYPGETLEPEVEAFLLELADDFIDNVATYSAAFARHRGSKHIEARDVALHLDRHWNMRIPGFNPPDLVTVPAERDRDLSGGYASIAAIPSVPKPELRDGARKRLALVAKAKEAELTGMLPPGEGAAGDRKRKRIE